MTDQTNVYMEQGGDRQVIASGGSCDVESGGEIDIESGGKITVPGSIDVESGGNIAIETGAEIDIEASGAIKIAGTDRTAALATAPAAVAAGYKIARGTMTPTTGSTTVVTGLATVVAAVASLKGDPTVTHLLSGANIGDQAGSPAAGSILITSWKPTAVNDVTPIDATTPWGTVDWIAVGT